MNTCRSWGWSSLAAGVMVVGLAAAAEARGGGCGCWADCGGCAVVERTVMVPTVTWERRLVHVTRWRLEPREHTVTVIQQVPETRQVSEEYTVMVPRTETRRVAYLATRPVFAARQEEYTVMVPHQETRQFTRQVQQMVPVRMTRTIQVPQIRYREEPYTVYRPAIREVPQEYTVLVPQQEVRQATRRFLQYRPVVESRQITVDRGHFETVAYTTGTTWCGGGCGCGNRWGGGCGACGGCTPCETVCYRQVWRPNPVQETIQVTVHRPEWVEQPYQFTVTRFVPQRRVRTVQIREMVPEQRTRQVAYTVLVPQEQEYTVYRPQWIPQTFERLVTVLRPETRTRMVEDRTLIQETRYRNVSQTVMVPERRTRVREVTYYRQVPVERTVTRMVSVPYTEAREVSVPVCRMVARTYHTTVRYAPCGGCCD